MTQRVHSIPFGAELQPDGGTLFRLWAPAARDVGLLLGQERLAMEDVGDGWWERHCDCGAGAHYRYEIDRELKVPDPASRFQPQDVHGPSEVIDPRQFAWQDADWRGRSWEEAVVYELHVGTFSPQGSFAGVVERLDYLADLGITVIELMPVADFPGSRNWGYDGVLPFAPASRYGRPEDLKALVQAAHRRGLMIMLDVVYNHFGPDGNYLHRYAPQFFSRRHKTAWGKAINFDDEQSRWVRQFFVHNACYWLEEYHFDGLRFDAVHAIVDDSTPHILHEIAQAAVEFDSKRRIHLVLENDDNAARYLAPAEDRSRGYRAQWNDDVHHVLHVLGTGERTGYYVDYIDRPRDLLGRCLAEGFAYQGEPSTYRHGARRGEPSTHLPLGAFVNFLQNHDQIGNRAFGERIASLAPPEAVRALTALLLLAPSPPMLFMGQEWGATQPFLYFCGFDSPLAEAVAEGRRNEFAHFPEFGDPARVAQIPDPNAPETFERSRLDWAARDEPTHRVWLDLHRELLLLRRREIAPRRGGAAVGAVVEALAERALHVHWRLGDGADLHLIANLGPQPVTNAVVPPGRALFVTGPDAAPLLLASQLPAWTVAWFLDDRRTA